MKFLIFSPGYDERSGGKIVLHNLCSIINELGYECYLTPHFESYIFNRKNIFKPLFSLSKEIIKSLLYRYQLKENLHTKIISHTDIGDINDYIVIYPEIILGNPLGAKNVVRWLLHQPGYHSGSIFYGKGELYFKFGPGIKDFNFTGSKTIDDYLRVVSYPFEHYNLENLPDKRFGTCYSIRKGKHKTIVHDLEDSILIDDKSNEEIAKIFKSSKRFISYDTLTAYSKFAVLCGCESIVVLDRGISKEQLQPDHTKRFGIAYGFEAKELLEAKNTAPKLILEMKREVEEVKLNVQRFIELSGGYFDT